MKSVKIVLVCCAFALLVPLVAQAQDPIVYPGKGQSNEQMEKDKYECYNWAKQQTGFDPMQVPTATSAPPSQQSEGPGVVGGAARGGSSVLARTRRRFEPGGRGIRSATAPQNGSDTGETDCPWKGP